MYRNSNKSFKITRTQPYNNVDKKINENLYFRQRNQYFERKTIGTSIVLRKMQTHKEV